MDKEIPEEVVEKVEEVPPDMQRAMEMGWKPQDQYEGEKRWVDYPEFLERQELYDGIHSANRKAKKLEKTINALMQHNKQIKEAAYKDALATLRKEKVAAAKENDIATVVAIDEQIEQVKEQAIESKTDSSSSNELFDEWKEENSWFNEDSPEYDPDMFYYANGVGNKLEKEHPEWSPEKILAEVAKLTKRAFNHKFKNPNREIPNKVSGKPAVNKKVETKKTITFDDLTPEAKGIYKTLVKSSSNPHGVMSAEQYLADYQIGLEARKNKGVN